MLVFYGCSFFMEHIVRKNTWNLYIWLRFAAVFFFLMDVQFSSNRSYFHSSMHLMNWPMKVSKTSIIQIWWFNKFNTSMWLGLKTPKSKQICEQTHQLVEKYTEIGLFLIRIVITPCFVLPKAIVSFFAYFTTDLGSDAFKLPAAMW